MLSFRPRAAFAVALTAWGLLLGTAGCGSPAIQAAEDGGPTSGSVELQWVFSDGSTCASLGTSISGIHVVTHGPQAIDQVFPCVDPSTGMSQATLSSLAGGSYTFTAQALVAGSAQVLYTGSGNFNVDGLRSNLMALQVNLTLVQGSNSNQLQLSWSFALAAGGSVGCTIAQVDEVQLQVGSAPPILLPCSAQGVQGALIPDLQAGTESIALQGLVGPNGVVAFSSATTVVLGDNGVTPLEVVLQPITGSLVIDYTFAGVGCLAAGVSRVGVSALEVLKDGGSGPDLTGFAPGTYFGCSDPGVFSWSFFPALPFDLAIVGEDEAGTPLWGATRLAGVDAGVSNQVRVSLRRCTEQPQACPPLQ